MVIMARTFSGGDATSELGFVDAAWLTQLPQHPVFSPTEDVSGNASGSCDATADDSRPAAMVVRGTDILVAHGKSLRMASLLEVKHRSGDDAAIGGRSSCGSYKRLNSAVLDFSIERLLVNPTGKLVVAIGSHKLAIVVLPRAGALHAQTSHLGHHRGASTSSDGATHAGEVNVKAALVGPFYHHDRIGGRGRLADVKWHPWGDKGSSLLVMTRNGILREYDVANDLEEPAQTVALLHGAQAQLDPTAPHIVAERSFSMRARSRSATPSAARRTSRRSSSRIAFDQINEDEDNSWDEDLDGADDTFFTANASVQLQPSPSAVAFTLGIDTGDGSDASPVAGRADWASLTIFTLCANGDVFSLCPFMPTNALVSLTFLHGLSSRIASTLAANKQASLQRDLEMQARYVSTFLKQARRHHLDRQNALPSSNRSQKPAPSTADEARGDGLVLVHAPAEALVPRQPTVQGPYLLAPEPHELSERLESVAGDIAYTRVTASDGEELGLIAIASTNGKIDICLLYEATLPQWPSDSHGKQRKATKSGRYALSDSEDEDDYVLVAPDSRSLDADEKNGPTLLVYESIDLGLLDMLKGDDPALETRLKEAPLRFVLDPIYPDVLYVQHIAGAHAIGIGSWTKALLASGSQGSRPDATNADDSIVSVESQPSASSAMMRFLHQGHKSDVVCVVKTISEVGLQASEAANSLCGLCIISDLYLCYAFLGLAQSGALVALELMLRTDDEIDGETERVDTADLHGDSSVNPEEAAIAPLYTSLLGDGPPFTPPDLLKTFRGLPSQPQTATKAWSAMGKDELRVTPDTLRKFAMTVQDLRGQIRAIVQAGNAVQSRLDLQMQELKRQLSKLDDVARRAASKRQGDVKNQTTGSTVDVQARLNRISAKQEELGHRSDRLLQKLIENHSPELSIYEKRWLEELERMTVQLGLEDGGTPQEVGASRQITIAGTRAVQMPKDPKPRRKETSGLAARIEALRYRLEVVKPEMEAMNGRRSDSTATKVTMFGSTQLREIEAMLASEAKVLLTDREKITQLNAAIRSQVGSLTQHVM